MHSPRRGYPANGWAYDEIFAGQLALMLVRASSRRRRGVSIQGDGRLRAMLKLPFAPTGAQTRAISEIDGDMAQATPMLRLLQGDVGSGKTLVALMALLNAVEAGMQGALLSPTEILARQHFAHAAKDARRHAGKRRDPDGPRKGQDARIRTDGLGRWQHRYPHRHACDFQEAVRYKALGLAVIDEQHRFGVAQRMMLADKAERAPHFAGDDRDPDPAHADADLLWRNGCQPAG